MFHLMHVFPLSWKAAPCFQMVLAAHGGFKTCHGWEVLVAQLLIFAANYRTGPIWRRGSKCSRWQIVLLHWGPIWAPSSRFSQGSLSEKVCSLQTHTRPCRPGGEVAGPTVPPALTCSES